MKRLFLILLTGCLLVACGEDDGPQVVAHRGFWKAEGAAQNSIASLLEAGRIGAYGSEFDVNLTADGQLVINHDFTYHGLTIYETDFATLRDTSLRLSNGEIIPSLDEYLAASKQYPKMKLVFELKSKGDPAYEAVAIPAAVEAIRRHGVADRVEFISFSLSACREFARLMPKNRVEYLEGDKTPAELHEMGINGIDFHYSYFNKHPEWVAQAHELGMVVNVWTVDRREDIIHMLQLGVDHVTTNEPELVQQLIAEGKYRLTPEDVTRNVVLETTLGDIELKLYGNTPLHSSNFLALVKEGAYDSLLFHRVIRDFMIQGGDPDSKRAETGVQLGEGDRNYTVPAEFRLEEGIFHRRGVLAAAREGDNVNPDQRSSAMQFYIVWGKIFDDEGLDKVQERLDSRTGGRVKLTPEMREVYRTVGGTPHLDGQYTVFGEVVSGLNVVDAIQQVATDDNDRPLEDVRILRARLK